MKQAKTVTLLIPYRNYDLVPFEIALKLMDRQTRPFDEILVSDLSSDEPFASEMEELCESYGVKYLYTSVETPGLSEKDRDALLSVFLWKTNYNIGIRASSSDLIAICGTDRVYEGGVGDAVIRTYNENQKGEKDRFVVGTCWRTGRVPRMEEFDDFDKLAEAGKCKCGLCMLATSKAWWHKVHGFDETLRWYADNDMYGRASRDGLRIRWFNRGGRAHKPFTKMIHLTTHRGSHRRFGGPGKDEISRRGKRFIHKRHPNRKVIRNDETWGIITKEKIDRAKKMLSFTVEQKAASRALWIEDHEEWLRVYA